LARITHHFRELAGAATRRVLTERLRQEEEAHRQMSNERGTPITWCRSAAEDYLADEAGAFENRGESARGKGRWGVAGDQARTTLVHFSS